MQEQAIAAFIDWQFDIVLGRGLLLAINLLSIALQKRALVKFIFGLCLIRRGFVQIATRTARHTE